MRTSNVLRAMAAAATSLAAATGLIAAGTAAHAWDTDDALVLPELLEATIVRTTTVRAASATRPAGSTVTFRFDEPVDGETALDPAGFSLWDDANPFDATEATATGDTVTAWFPELDSAGAVQRLTLASVAADTVRDREGHPNPLASDQVWTVRTYTSTGLRGCPALRRVTNVQLLRRATEADFVFACEGTPDFSARPDRFHLQLADGATSTGLRKHLQYRNGLAVVTVKFPGRHPARTIARGTVDTGAAHWTYGAHDPMGDSLYQAYETGLQAAAVSHRGNTVRPDLVNVALQQDRRAGRPDHAVFTFDQKVAALRPGRFLLYPKGYWTRGDGLGRGTRAVAVKARPRQVRVTFPAGTVSEATHAAVTAGAVRDGRVDEVPVTNTFTDRSNSDGYTSGPDLAYSGVSLDTAANVPAALFLFDAELSGQPQASAFALYTPAGDRLDPDSCGIEPAANGELKRVRCTFPGQQNLREEWGGGIATVDPGAVQDTAARTNPPGVS